MAGTISNGKNRGDVADVPLRWSLRKAAREHGVHENTIQNGLKKHGIAPGADQKYSTLEIDKAIFDSERYDAQTKEAKTIKAIAEAEKAQQEMLELRGELVRVSTLDECLAEIFSQLAQRIRHLHDLT